MRAETVSRYLEWLRKQGVIPGTETIVRHVASYCRQSALQSEYLRQQTNAIDLAKDRKDPEWDAQKPRRVARAIARDAAVREERILQKFGDEVHRLIQERDPLQRMKTKDGAPVFDGSPASLFHPHWVRRSLMAGARDGAAVGIISAVLSVITVAFFH